MVSCSSGLRGPVASCSPRCTSQQQQPVMRLQQYGLPRHCLRREASGIVMGSRASGLCKAASPLAGLGVAAEQAAQAVPLHTLADAAAVATSPAAQEAAAEVKRSGGGLLAPLTDGLEFSLRFLQSGLDALHVPYSYGYSIILLTLIVKILTFPLTKQQVESALAVQSLKPRVDLIKARYGDDKDKVSKETSKLYEQAGVNPLAGCLPTLATIPIFIGLYSSLTNVANAGDFGDQGFYWLPSIAGPVSAANRGIDWLYPFVDGAPPIGWEAAKAYLVLPVVLVILQYISTATISTPPDPSDSNATTYKVLNAILPLTIGWFALNVPSGLGLYYLCNTAMTLIIQVYLRKLGGAEINVKDLGPVTKPGSGRRTGAEALGFVKWQSEVAKEVEARKAAELKALDEDDADQEAAMALAAATEASGSSLPSLGEVSWVVKRKRLDLIPRV